MMSLKTQAVRLGNSYRLPVHILYRSTPGRLGGDLSFSDAIRAKYASGEEEELPSADFVYPKFGETDASELLQVLSRQLIQLNRIRIRMNVNNYRYLQRYSSAVSIRCEQLFNRLQTQNNMYSGVSAESVLELKKIHSELLKQTAESVRRAQKGEKERPSGMTGALSAQQTYSRTGMSSSAEQEDENALILRILSASSRGNGTRERYMRQLVTRLRTIESDENPGRNPAAASPAAQVLLQKAGTELFQLIQNGGDPSISLWHSESARQFFWRIQRAPETERRFILEAGGYSSLVTFEKVLKTMDDDTFRAFAEPLLMRAEESLQDSSVMDNVTAPSADYADNDWAFLYRSVERVFTHKEESAGDHDMDIRPGGFESAELSSGRTLQNAGDGMRERPEAAFPEDEAYRAVSLLSRFFEEHEEEDWEIFRTELIHADHDGNLKGEAPELYEAFASVREPSGHDLKERMITEKETLFRILREERDSGKHLQPLVMETIRRVAVIRENQKEYMSLAESIMNLTKEQWTQFKNDVHTLREEDLDIRETIPETVFRETVSVSEHTRLSSEVLENRERIRAQSESEQIRLRTVREQEQELEKLKSRESFIQEGVRMSTEKLNFLRLLKEQLTRQDTVFTDTGRKIFLHTVLKNTDAGRLIRPSFRELSAEGRESWSRFVTELLHLNRSGSEHAMSPGAAYFGKLAAVYGSGRTDREDETSSPRAAAAIRLLEQRRLERTLDTETLSERIREAETSSETEKVYYRLLPREQETPAESADLPEFTAADITVQRTAAGHITEEQKAAAAALLKKTEQQSRTESYTDIEFETVHHTVREEESREMKTVTEILDRHERDIAGLLKAQKQNAGRDVPKEVIRQINDMLRMERLRGGR